jgi:hypothetical protein
MQINKSLVRFAPLLLSGFWVLPASADWLDVIAERIEVKNLRTGQSGPNLLAQEGDVLEISCTEFIDLYGSHDKWVASTPQRWENRVKVDGKTLAIFNGELPQGTTFQKPKFANRPKTYAPVQWVASGIGNHEASCVLNQPKKISDHVVSNNVINALINVTASVPVVKGTLKEPPSRQVRPAPAAVTIVVEAESLIATAVTSGGGMVRQDMTEYGSGWGGNAQLFWRPPEPSGAEPHLLTEFSVQRAGNYDLVLFYTTAPDFGQFTVHFDGRRLINLDGYGPQVGLTQILLGTYPLAAGRHELAFEVTGKSPRSTGYIIGIDRLQLNPHP